MVYLKYNETGEWNKYINLEYVENNPECNSDECEYIKSMKDYIDNIIFLLDNKNCFKLIDIIGFDMYTGPKVIVKIFDKQYNIWSNQNNPYSLYIENFPINNINTKYDSSGYVGDIEDISKLINEINLIGDINIYSKIKEFNL